MPTIKRHLANVTAFATAIEAMMDDDQTVDELVALTGLHENTVRKMVRALHGRVIYIERWVTDSIGRYTTASYCVGRHPDAKKPAKAKELTGRSHWKRRRSAFDVAGPVAIDRRVAKLEASHPPPP